MIGPFLILVFNLLRNFHEIEKKKKKTKAKKDKRKRNVYIHFRIEICIRCGCLLKTDLIGLKTKSDSKGQLVQKLSLSAFRIVLICLSQLQTRGANHFQAFPRDLLY
jgi:hypothetical protein